MAMKNKSFAVFILSYGRADRVITVETLRKGGYTGDIYIVCSDDDKTIPEYKTYFRNRVIVFSKDEYEGKFDIGDNFKDKRVVVYARNANFDIAKRVGVEYFLQLDDDYQSMEYKIPTAEKLLGVPVKNLDRVFDYFIDYHRATGRIKSIAFAQGGDFIGGKDNDIHSRVFIQRKLMNCYINKTDSPYTFYGRINEDTTCYVTNGMRGDLFLTCPVISVTQKATQANAGGLTEIYLDTGTYVKSFYSVMFSPSSVKVRAMGDKHYRLHHSVRWANAVPVIVDEQHKKK